LYARIQWREEGEKVRIKSGKREIGNSRWGVRGRGKRREEERNTDEWEIEDEENVVARKEKCEQREGRGETAKREIRKRI
jgi:hypothetical protein